MFKPSDTDRGAVRRGLRASATIGLLIVAGAAAAGVNTTGRVVREESESAPPVRTLPAPAAKDVKAGYQLRCWQYGKLLFEEHLAALPTDARSNVRMTANDRSGRPLQVVETQNSTCLVRVAPPDERPLGDERR